MQNTAKSIYDLKGLENQIHSTERGLMSKKDLD